MTSDKKIDAIYGPILDLAKTNPTIAHGVKCYLHNDLPYVDMLELVCVSLAGQNHDMHRRVLDVMRKSSEPIYLDTKQED